MSKIIKKQLKCSHGSDESCEAWLQVDTSTGESEIIVEKSIREYHKVTDHDKAMDLFDRLTCGGGRQVYSLEDLAHPYNPK